MFESKPKGYHHRTSLNSELINIFLAILLVGKYLLKALHVSGTVPGSRLQQKMKQAKVGLPCSDRTHPINQILKII